MHFLFSAAAAAAASGAPSGCVTGLGERGEGSSPSCEIRHPARPSLVPSRNQQQQVPNQQQQELLPGRRPKLICLDFGSAPPFISNRFGVWRSSSTKGKNRQIVSRPNAGKALGAESRERECARVCVVCVLACCVEAVLLI